MRVSPFLIALLLQASSSLFAQRQADWSVELTGDAQRIIFQDMTGVPIIQTEKAYVGIDPASQKVAWTAQRAADKALSGVVEVSGTDFFNVYMTPYVLVRHNLIDSRDGKIILDKEKEHYKKVNDYEVIPALNSVLVRTTAEGMLRLYLVDMRENTVKWKVDVVKSSGLAIKTGGDEQPEEERIDVPVNTTMLTSGGQLLYQHKKNLACIDAHKGTLLWVEKPDPAEILLSPDGKTVLVVEAQSGGLMAMAMTGTGPKLKDKKIYAFDLLSGKKAWKDDIETDEDIRWVDAHPDFLTVVHKKGCNLYDYATGEKRWKKDFEGRRVVEIKPNAEGYLVFFKSGYKYMQLSPEGKELWKKPKEQEVEGEAPEVPEDGGLDRYSYAKGDVLVDAEAAWFLPVKGSGMKPWKFDLDADARVAYDESRKNVILLTNKKMVIVNPDNYASVAVGMNLNLNRSADFHTLELRDNSYFLTGQQEYVLVWPDDQNKIVHKYYKKPFDGTGLLINVAGAGMAVGAGAMAVSGTMNTGMGASKALGATFGMLPPGSGNSEIRRANRQFAAVNALSNAGSMMPPARFEAFKQTRDFAYYFTKEKNGDDAEKILVKVSKDSGEEKDKLIFDNARPLYSVDEVQRRVYYANKNVLKVFNM